MWLVSCNKISFIKTNTAVTLRMPDVLPYSKGVPYFVNAAWLKVQVKSSSTAGRVPFDSFYRRILVSICSSVNEQISSQLWLTLLCSVIYITRNHGNRETDAFESLPLMPSHRACPAFAAFQRTKIMPMRIELDMT